MAGKRWVCPGFPLLQDVRQETIKSIVWADERDDDSKEMKKEIEGKRIPDSWSSGHSKSSHESWEDRRHRLNKSSFETKTEWIPCFFIAFLVLDSSSSWSLILFSIIDVDLPSVTSVSVKRKEEELMENE